MTTLVGLVCHLLSLFYPVNSLCWDEVTHLLLQFGALCECPTLLAPALKDRTLMSLVGDLLPALHQARGCVPSGSSGQAGMVERSCTKWLGLRLVLPAAVAVTMGGCQTAAQTACSEMWIVISAQQGNCQPGMCHSIKPCHS